ncbi:hypothetical protein B0T11DRAFT_273922 [Plectosphaerella cucumerina]|uniref:Uncharacterized protein n=1 Tax=Plectosphaerella cucumerina TaxID=40658 RepID=A0A8K0X4Y7_9PEZI|nr:hypothetical protein B0T11DRAFT_273922 [Plectosphaerella cucumerina]
MASGASRDVGAPVDGLLMGMRRFIEHDPARQQGYGGCSRNSTISLAGMRRLGLSQPSEAPSFHADAGRLGLEPITSGESRPTSRGTHHKGPVLGPTSVRFGREQHHWNHHVRLHCKLCDATQPPSLASSVYHCPILPIPLNVTGGSLHGTDIMSHPRHLQLPFAVASQKVQVIQSWSYSSQIRWTWVSLQMQQPLIGSVPPNESIELSLDHQRGPRTGV